MMLKGIFLFLFTVCFVSEGAALDKLRLSAFNAANLTPIAEQKVRAAYELLGIEIELVKANPRRALLAAAHGETDGELVRVGDIEHRFPTLKKVNVPLLVAETYAFTNRRELQGKSMEALRKLRVGHVDGAQFAKRLSEGFREVWQAETPEQLFEMLLIDRLDLVIVGEETGQRIISKKNLETVFALEPPLASVPFYHYLHERHEALIPRVEDALRKVVERLDANESGQDQGRQGMQLYPLPGALHLANW